jgi:DNA-binding response OmpR family regulator
MVDQNQSAESHRVLVVDDDADIRESLATVLSHLGYVALLAPDRDHALNVILADKPTAIMLDWKMPGMSIEDFLDKVDEVEEPPCVLFMTADIKGPEKARELQVKHYLRKPFDLDVLERTLRECIAEPG